MAYVTKEINCKHYCRNILNLPENYLVNCTRWVAEQTFHEIHASFMVRLLGYGMFNVAEAALIRCLMPIILNIPFSITFWYYMYMLIQRICFSTVFYSVDRI